MVSSWSIVMRSSAMAERDLVAVVVGQRLAALDGLGAHERLIQAADLAVGVAQQRDISGMMLSSYEQSAVTDTAWIAVAVSDSSRR